MALSSNNMLTTGGRRQRQRGSVRVSEPANGFFIAGSSIDSMNGVYVRKNPPKGRDMLAESQFALYYMHEESAWQMALKSLSDDEQSDEEEEDDYFYSRRKRKPEYEWVFIDECGKERFAHDGDTIVPGAGVRWKHVHELHVPDTSALDDTSLLARDDDNEESGSRALSTIAPDDEDELPWQVIAILDWETVQELLWSSEYRRRKVREAQQGKTAKAPPRASLEGSLSAAGGVGGIGGCWLFRVLATEGVDLFLQPDDSGDSGAQEVGHADCGQFLRGQELSGDGEWLRLDKCEDVFLSKEARVKQQQHHRSYLSDDDNDDDDSDDGGSGWERPREFFNAELARREIWVRVWVPAWGGKGGKCFLLEEVTSTDSAVLGLQTVGDLEEEEEELSSSLSLAEREAGGASGRLGAFTGDYFDQPFVPRMVDGSADDSLLAVPEAEELSALANVTEEESTGRVDVGSAPPVGSAVVVSGLNSRAGMQYNGVAGVVVSAVGETTGRLGVRLEAPFSGKVLACRPDSLVFCKPSGEEKSTGMEEVWRAARLLELSLNELGLGTAGGRQAVGAVWGFLGSSPEEKIGTALRAVLRDLSSGQAVSVLSLSSASDAAREAASVLLRAVEQSVTPEKATEKATENDTENDTENSAVALEISPEHLIRCGALGSRAAAAMVSALSRSSLLEREAGLRALQDILRDEVLRSRCQRDSVTEQEGEASAGIDEWLLRVGLVQALLESGREAEALEEAQRALRFAENDLLEKSCCWECSRVLLALCLLRLGKRADGFSAMEKAQLSLSLGPISGRSASPWTRALAKWAKRRCEELLHVNSVAEQMRTAAVDAYARGSFEDGAALYGKVIAILQNKFPEDKRGRATALADRAGCLRRARKLEDAVSDLDSALRLFPHYTRAIYRRAACLLEAGKATEAVDGFQDLYRIDRNWPNLSEWLVRAFSLQKRQARGYHKKGQEEQQYEETQRNDSPATATTARGESNTSFEADRIAVEVDHYAVLGVSTDATEKQLKTAYRMRSLKFHPDRKEGHTAAFQRIAEAFEVLSDIDRRRAYDEGGDIKVKRGRRNEDDCDDNDSEEEDEAHKTSLREEVEREFYPERYHFWPFGDPFIYKRKREAQKRAREGRPAWQQEEDWGA